MSDPPLVRRIVYGPTFDLPPGARVEFSMHFQRNVIVRRIRLDTSVPVRVFAIFAGDEPILTSDGCQCVANADAGVSQMLPLAAGLSRRMLESLDFSAKLRPGMILSFEVQSRSCVRVISPVFRGPARGFHALAPMRRRAPPRVTPIIDVDLPDISAAFGGPA